ncbi:protein FAR1-RELATED SEQUENCE 6-like [Trifolium pratense]|uniref:protein FAR1-RELATED SEQUENCE 6-like n=1 Tax=Trifolium pratense TaxID=57577 RepID=UPI001E6958C7|nr:protein FAR1-RELATED SEQUENCE 6-like [Trifolium pratense]
MDKLNNYYTFTITVEEVVVSSDGEEINEENNTCEDSLEANIVHEGEKPHVGMIFSSIDELTEYYKRYGQSMGFGVTKRSSKNGDDGKKYFTLACSRGTKYVSKSKNLLKPNPITKTQCKARLNGCIGLDGTVTISRIVLEHNHDVSPTKARYFRSSKKLEPHLKKRLKLNDQAGINVSRNFRSLVIEAGGYDNLTFGEKDCRNYIDKVRRLRLGTGDADAIQNYFVRMQKKNSQFYYVVDIDDNSRLRNVFWVDARCRVAYEYFGEVVTFDTTYLTNKYDMPFAPFVGVNHHGQSVLLGCALLSNEDTETFTWLFSTWLDSMHGHTPNAIIIDQDKAMKNAIEVVFPKARHRWCLWHIMKKVPEKLGRRSDYESIKELLHYVVYDSLSKSDFMEKWEKMIEDFKLQDNEWLKGLFDERNRWVPVFLRDTFWAGMSTTQRSESMNSFFDGYVNSKTTLKQFVEQYDNALRDKIEKENLADFGSFNTSIACLSHYGFESQFQKAFTNAKFKEFQDEVTAMIHCHTFIERLDGLNSIYSVIKSKKKFDKINDILFKVSFNEKDFEIQCMCCLFQFKGILCRHILCVLKLIGKTESIPSYYIFSQWRKDIRRRHTHIKCGFDHFVGNVELQRVDKACAAFYEVASKVINSDHDFLKMMNWIKDIKDEFASKETSPTSIVEEDGSEQNQVTKILDPVKTRCKGRPPSNRKSSKVDQIVKKLARKRTQKRSKKKGKDQGQKENLCSSRVQESVQVIDGIDTRESIQCEQSSFGWNGQGGTNNLAPFNPNSVLISQVNQVPFYSQVMNHGVSYFELLQAQHHVNDPSSSTPRESYRGEVND